MGSDSGAVNQLCVKQVQVLLRLEAGPYSVGKGAQLWIIPCTDLFFKDNSFEHVPKSTALVVKNGPLPERGEGGIHRFAHEVAGLMHWGEIPHQKDNWNATKRPIRAIAERLEATAGRCAEWLRQAC